MDPIVRPLRAIDLDDADRIFRLAFGTFVGMPDPLQFAGDSDWVQSRFRTDPDAAFAAEIDGRLVGTNLVTTWGSVGFFGPLSVHPERWDAGIAKRLLGPTMDLFAARGTRHTGLFTFPQSTKHVGLYQRFGFWPRSLTAVMAKPVDGGRAASSWSTVSTAGRDALADIRTLTNAVYDGLDVTHEIDSVGAQQLGDTVLLHDDGALVGVAICHCGAGSEAGSGTCYVKFGAALPGAQSAERFERLLDAVERFAHGRRLDTVTAGVNTARTDAYRRMLARGYRNVIQGVQMVRGDDVAFHRSDAYVLDDWR